MPLTVLGLDPGIRCTGYAIVTAPSELVCCGTWRPSPKAPFGERLLHLSEHLDRLIQDHRPDHCVVENIFHSTNARSALVLGHVRGALIVTALRRGCAVHEYTALQIKKAVTGHGKAEKEQVRSMVQMLLNFRSGRMALDSSDAIAAALCHIQTWQTQARISQLEQASS